MLSAGSVTLPQQLHHVIKQRRVPIHSDPILHPTSCCCSHLAAYPSIPLSSTWCFSTRSPRRKQSRCNTRDTREQRVGIPASVFELPSKLAPNAQALISRAVDSLDLRAISAVKPFKRSASLQEERGEEAFDFAFSTSTSCHASTRHRSGSITPDNPPVRPQQRGQRAVASIE